MATKKPDIPQLVSARVLLACTIDGADFRPDDIVILSPELASQYASVVDSNPDAVAYASALKV